MFEVLNDFIEKEHKDLLYKAGETYPKAGFEADPKRVEYLQSNKNVYKKAFLGPELTKETKEKAPKEHIKVETNAEVLTSSSDENEDKEDKEKPKRTTKKETNK